MKQELLLPAILVLLLAPAPVLADVSLVQTYCEQYVEGSDDLIIIHMSLVNFSLPAPVCGMHLVPEPQPSPPPGCLVVDFLTPPGDFRTPPGWQGFLNSSGGVDWIPNGPIDCVPVMGSQDGFGIVVAIPDWCCYIVQFSGPDGEVMHEQQECFTCTLIENEAFTWGSLKGLYN